MEKDIDILVEIMTVYDNGREKWKKEFGIKFDEKIFHAWFTEQIKGV